MMKTHFVLDFETLGTSEDTVVLSMAMTVFNIEELYDFQHYLSETKYWKFDVQSQLDVGRTIKDDTLTWWSKQDEEVQREQLNPSDQDLTLEQFLIELYDFCKLKEINKSSIGWARGKEFDFGILKHIIQTTKWKLDKELYPMSEEFFPTPFWNRRDIRDYIAGLMVSPYVTKVPLPNGSIEGFRHHDPVHDCARAVMHILYAQKYAMGELDLPEDSDPNSNK